MFGEARRESDRIQSTAWMDEEEGVGRPLSKAGADGIGKGFEVTEVCPRDRERSPSRWTPKPSLPSTLRAKFWMCMKAAMGGAAALCMPGRL